MVQTNPKIQPIAAIGEAISPELGAQMIRQYQELHPADTHNYLIGRDIIDQILAQPGCVGIKFYNAINEIGEKTLVYVGVDLNGTDISNITTVTSLGNINSHQGIIADRVRPTGGSSTIDSEPIDWSLE